MNTFENSQIDFDAIPKAEELVLKPIQRSHLKLQLAGNIAFFGILLLAAILVGQGWIHENTMINYPFNLLIYAVLLLFLILGIIIPIMAFKWKSYAIRDKDIIFRKGLIFRKWTHIPFNRVQHCEVSQGVLDRYFDLSKLKVYTAGGSNSDLSIPGLKFQEAQDLKSFILKKAAVDEFENA